MGFSGLVQERLGDCFPKHAPCGTPRGPARNHRLRSFSFRMKLRFISARLNPWDAWAPPSMAPHSFGKQSPKRSRTC